MPRSGWVLAAARDLSLGRHDVRPAPQNLPRRLGPRNQAKAGHTPAGALPVVAPATRGVLNVAPASTGGGEPVGEPLDMAAPLGPFLERPEPVRRDGARPRAGGRDRPGHRADRVGVAAAAHRKRDRY